MSTVRKADQPVAVLCSDIHLSMKPPAARAGEPDWFAAMARPLREMSRLANDLGVGVVCAGDIFDRWNSPPELINFALQELPRMWAIPGQHDLPCHRLEDVDRSAFNTLMRADKVVPLSLIPVSVGQWLRCGEWLLYGFPWGQGIVDPPTRGDGFYRTSGRKTLAVVHQYVHKPDASYPGAKDLDRIDVVEELRLTAYTAAAFGDNHIGFTSRNSTIMNCGGLMRRASDEGGRRPMVGILFDSGHIEPYYLDTSADVFEPVAKAPVTAGANEDFEGFLKRLADLQSDPLDFHEQLTRAAAGHGVEVQQLVAEVLDG